MWYAQAFAVPASTLLRSVPGTHALLLARSHRSMLRIYTIDVETRRSVMHNKPDNSYVFWFWPVWIILLSIIIFMRMTVLRGTPTNIRFFWMLMYITLVEGSIIVTI